MSKNPFPNEVKLVALCPMGSETKEEFTLYWLRTEDDQPIGMSENQAKYAANAINQHEAMVRALTRLSMCTPSRTDVIIARTILYADAAFEKEMGA